MDHTTLGGRGRLALGIQSPRLGGSPGHLQGPYRGIAGDSLGSSDGMGASFSDQPPRRQILAVPVPVMLQTRTSKFPYKPLQWWPSAPAWGWALVKPPRVLPGLSLPGPDMAIPWETCHHQLLNGALTMVLLPFWVTQKLRIRLDFLFQPLKLKRTSSLLGNQATRSPCSNVAYFGPDCHSRKFSLAWGCVDRGVLLVSGARGFISASHLGEEGRLSVPLIGFVSSGTTGETTGVFSLEQSENPARWPQSEGRSHPTVTSKQQRHTYDDTTRLQVTRERLRC